MYYFYFKFRYVYEIRKKGIIVHLHYSSNYDYKVFLVIYSCRCVNKFSQYLKCFFKKIFIEDSTSIRNKIF